MQYIAPLANLIEHFRALPGIGQKTAVRLAYHVLDMDAAAAKSLAGAILEAKEKIGYCSTCFNLSDRNPCAICDDEKRDHSVICVVEQPQDVAAMERMHEYKGVYHVLHGSRASAPTTCASRNCSRASTTRTSRRSSWRPIRTSRGRRPPCTSRSS